MVRARIASAVVLSTLWWCSSLAKINEESSARNTTRTKSTSTGRRSSSHTSWSSSSDVKGESRLRQGKMNRIIPVPPPTTRANRFPSVEERVKLYMSNWYVPPCSNSDDGFIRYRFRPSLNEEDEEEEWPILLLQGLEHHPLVNTSESVYHLENIVEPDTLFFMDTELMQYCAKEIEPEVEEMAVKTSREMILSTRVKAPLNMQMYCSDIKNLMLPALRHVDWENEGKTAPPTLLQFGDNKRSHNFGNVHMPHLKKFRSAARSKQDLAKVTSVECHSKPRHVLRTVHTELVFQPIIWKLATHRHFGFLSQISQWDTPWSEKEDKAIFRGQLTGSKDFYKRKESDLFNCMNMKRCRLVYNHAKSKTVDAKLTSTRRRLPHVLNGVPLVAPKSFPEDLLKYKGLVMIEGNDVASGLKWALLSQSVVLMPPPQHSSWAMEELLVPWVHYIPLDEFATNIEERMQWILENDKEAQRIAERATLWMEDLVFHPDAAEDDRLIQEEIMRRYQAHFRPV
jgi:hypothetical protein